MSQLSWLVSLFHCLCFAQIKKKQLCREQRKLFARVAFQIEILTLQWLQTGEGGGGICLICCWYWRRSNCAAEPVTLVTRLVWSARLSTTVWTTTSRPPKLPFAGFIFNRSTCGPRPLSTSVIPGGCKWATKSKKTKKNSLVNVVIWNYWRK